MREIVSPLSGIRSPFGQRRDPYKALGFKPELVADFGSEYYRADGGRSTFDGLTTFSRASSATMVDSTGTLVTVGVDEPRIGHHVWNGSAWVNEGLLIESEARTNLLTYSSEFDNPEWSKAKATISTNAAMSPDGTVTAQKLSEDSSTGEHYLQDSVTYSSGTYTNSVYVKAAEYSKFSLRPIHIGDVSGSPSSNTIFDLTAGTITPGSSAAYETASLEDVGGGWYRASVTVTVSGSVSVFAFRIHLLNDVGAISYAGDGTSGMYVWGSQLEEGSTPSSYIPTSGSTATRAAETLTIPAANLPWSSSAVSIQMEGRMTYAQASTLSADPVFTRWLFDNDNRIVIYVQQKPSNPSDMVFLQEEANVADVSVSLGVFTPGILVPFNIASRHGSTFINGAVDGTALTVNTTPTALPDLSATDLLVGQKFMGTVKTFRIWAKDLGDTGIAEASS